MATTLVPPLPSVPACEGAEVTARSAGTILPLTARSAATLSGRGTGYGALENAWTRQKTGNGQVYYFNQATGNSQWHLPNELYESQLEGSPPTARTAASIAQEEHVVFPGAARATLFVDCVTESLPDGALPTGAGDDSPFAAGAHDPRDVAGLLSMLPADLHDTVCGAAFKADCLGSFDAVAGSSGLPLTDVASLLVSCAGNIRSNPALSLGSERARHFAARYGAAHGLKTLRQQEFLDFALFAVAAQYLEQLAVTDNP